MIVVHHRWKFCARCHEAKPRTLRHFYYSQRAKRGGWWDSYCRPCRRRMSAEQRAQLVAEHPDYARELSRRARAAQRAANPERERAARRRAWQAVVSDPERHIRNRQDRRIDSVLRGERTGTKQQATAVGAYRPCLNGREYLAPEPFAQWLRETFGDANPVEVARIIACEPKQVRGVLNGTLKRIGLTVVDRAFVRVGRPDLLQVLYP